MGAFLDKPRTEKHNESGSGNGLRFGMSSMQGWRVDMEDAHTATNGVGKLSGWSFFAVFDGHAGSKVAEYSAEHLLPTIVNSNEWQSAVDGVNSNPSQEVVEGALKTGFLAMDTKLREMPEHVSGEDKSGSTAVSVIVAPSCLYFANLGDSRAVYSKAGNCAFSTHDHKPYNPIEKQRIENAGGSVMIQRVNGSLAVSRALGDFEYKGNSTLPATEQLVSPQPDVTRVERAAEDEFIVLACDGIWDVMSNEDVIGFIRSRMLLTDDLASIGNQVIDTCLYKGSRDNMSIIIIAFDGAPKVSDEAKQREQKLDEAIEAAVKRIVEQTDPSQVDLPYVMHLMGNEEIENLPPGGQLFSKRQVVENAFYKLVPKKEDDQESGQF